MCAEAVHSWQKMRHITANGPQSLLFRMRWASISRHGLPCHVIAKEFGLGAQDGFQFNSPCGYDLAGIKGDKVNTFIDGMMEAKDTCYFPGMQEMASWTMLTSSRTLPREDIEAIPSECL